MTKKRILTLADIERIANDTDPAGFHELETIEAAQALVNFMAGDERAGYRILMNMADQAIDKYERDVAGTVYSTYIIRSLGWATLPDGREVTPGQPIYVGRTRDTTARDRLHREDASSPAKRVGRAIADAIWALRQQNVEVYLQPVATDLTLEDAKRAEASLIQSLLEHGHPLQNRLVLDCGKGETVNHHKPGTEEYEETDRANKREYSRNQRAPEAGRIQHLASIALSHIKSGRPLTPRRRYWIEQASRAKEAKAILAVLRRSGEWLEEPINGQS